jgi:predicted outer membrane protein
MASGIQRSSRRVRALGIVALALMGVGLGGCVREDAGTPPTGTEQRQPEEALTEPQIMGVVSTFNRGELEQVQTALQITDDAEVRTYAQRMIAAHQTSEKRLEAILPEIGLERVESNLSEEVQSTGETMNQNLKNLAIGQDPDVSYMELQIFMHRRALALLDDHLIPKANRPEIRSFLQEARGSVQAHLIEALRIRRRFPQAI